MDRDKLKIDLIGIFTTKKYIEPPIIDAAFIDDYMYYLLVSIENNCSYAIECGEPTIQITELPKIIDKLNELEIQHTITHDQPFEPVINIMLEELARWSNYTALMSLKE